jgi:hypothetical protein
MRSTSDIPARRARASNAAAEGSYGVSSDRSGVRIGLRQLTATGNGITPVVVACLECQPLPIALPSLA